MVRENKTHLEMHAIPVIDLQPHGLSLGFLDEEVECGVESGVQGLALVVLQANSTQLSK